VLASQTVVAAVTDGGGPTVLCCAVQACSPCGESQRCRRLWLQTNQPLLRMFLSYCSLHGSHGGGLASVRMELILLLQESHQVSRWGGVWWGGVGCGVYSRQPPL